MATNAAEEQPYVLSVGTEVSAKFKGAFCEAKIKRVDRAVKCKLNFKNSSDSATLVESQVLGANGQPISHNELKIGSTVYASGSGSELKQATLVKILDQSLYNVVFNDGDERSLKRSFIRFKGEKHFLDSETLNNAPLNNPEHFLFPISKLEATDAPGVPNKSKTRNQTKNKTENESDTDSKATTKKLKTEKKDIDGESKANESISDQSDKSGSAESTDEENSSDDYPPEEKDRFVAQLYKFMDDRGTPLNQLPSINRIDLDLHKFFIVVKKFGGFNRVCRQRLWLDVYKRLGLSNVTSSNVINLKCAYKRYLHPYEDFYRKLGSTVCDLPSLRQASSASVSRRLSSSDSRRQLFKPRFLATPIATSSASKKTPATINKVKKGQVSENVTSSAVEPSVAADLPTTNIELKRLTSQTDSENENKEEATNNNSISQNLFMSNSVATSNESNDEQSSQNCSEELTIFSMVQTIRAKKEKEKEISSNVIPPNSSSGKKSTENSATKSTPIKAQSGVKEPVAKATSLSASSTTTKRPLSAGNGKNSANRRLSSDKVVQPGSVGSSSSATAKKSKSETNQLSGANSEGEYDGEDEEDEPKTKKKSTRYVTEESSSSSSTTKGTTKRKNSLSSKNNDTDHDGELVPITIHDLDLTTLIEVKYGNGKQDFKAKIIEIDTDKNKLLVHYQGWNARYDEWIEIGRIAKVQGDQFCGNKKRKSHVKPASSAPNSSEVATTTVVSSTSTNSAKTSTKIESPNVASESKTAVKASTSQQQNQTQSKVKESAAKRQSSPSTISSSSSTASEPPSNPPVINKKSAEPVVSTNSKSNKEEESKTAKSSESSTSCVSEPNIGSSDNALQHSASNTSVKSVCSFDSLIEMTIKNEFQKEMTSQKGAGEVSGGETSSEKMFSIQSIKKEIVEFDTNTENESAAENNAKSECSSSSNLISAIVAQELLDSPTDPLSIEPVVVIAESVSSSRSSEKRRSSEMEKIKKDKFMLRRSSEQTNNETAVTSKASKAKNNDIDKPEMTNIFFKNKKKPIEEPTASNTAVEAKKVDESEAKSDKESINKENDCQTDKNKTKKSNKEESTTKETVSISNENQANKKQSVSELSNLTNNKGSEETTIKQPTIEYKYPFHLIGCTLVGKQKIRFIEEQMRLCRDEYNKLKNEVAEIDRKKKRLRRNLQEKQLASSSSSGANLNHSTANTAGSMLNCANDDKESKQKN